MWPQTHDPRSQGCTTAAAAATPMAKTALRSTCLIAALRAMRLSMTPGPHAMHVSSVEMRRRCSPPTALPRKTKRDL
jgi:hypothetical protein